MTEVKRLRKRGAKVTVTAFGEVLFMPNGEVNRWTRRLNNRIRTATIAAAPTNKRPRWAHYGKPLKASIQGSQPSFRMAGPDSPRIHAAVGSTAPHALFVDQGTGIYAGNGPYEAKILPPWTRGSPSLYESTWKTPEPGTGRWTPVGRVMIKGQKGQHFFEEGLKRGFQSMRLGSRFPTDPRIGAAMAAFPETVANFRGNTPTSGAFVGQLEEWRAWRDEAWSGGRLLGVRPRAGKNTRRLERVNTPARRVGRAKPNPTKRREQMKRAEPKTASNKNTGRQASIQADRARVKAIAKRRYPDSRYSVNMQFDNGQWTAVVSLRGFEVARLKSSKKF